jgi:hypothetical protein
MSDTIIDMPKVTQMLDAGWCVKVFKNGMNSYTAAASHHNLDLIRKANNAVVDAADLAVRQIVKEAQDDWQVGTDDFTPEKALTRLAYKVHGEII